MSAGFPMLAGVHQASYAKNSEPQNYVLLRCRPLLERAIATQQLQLLEMMKKKMKVSAADGDDGVDVFRVADMGCSSGPNCLSNMQFMLDAIAKHNSNNVNCLALQPFFCDLPTNDFNTLFQLLHAQSGLYPSSQHGYFPAAVAGTVYGRLFPSSSLHLVFSSCCLHWLSQIPATILKPNTKEWNQGKIWVDGPDANEAAGRVYAQQWQQDFQTFFISRSEEMVSGGMMFLVISCRPDTFPSHKMHEESCFRNMELSWKQLIQEGVVDQSDLDSFNIPMYLPTQQEVLFATNAVPNVKVQCLEMIEEAIGDKYWQQWSHDPREWAIRVDRFYRSVFWNVMEKHVGSAKCKAIFERFRELLQSSFENLSCWDSYWVYPWSYFAVVQLFKDT